MYAVSFDGFDGTGETTYTTARDQADILSAYIEKELDGQLDLLFAESLGCGPAVFLKASPTVQIRLDDPERFGVSGFRSVESTDFEGYAAKAISNGTRKSTCLHGRCTLWDRRSRECRPCSAVSRIISAWNPSGLLGRQDFIFIERIFLVQPDAKVACWYGEKESAHEKGHPAAADGISEPDCPLLPRFLAMARSSTIRHCLRRSWNAFWRTAKTEGDALKNQESEIQ